MMSYSVDTLRHDVAHILAQAVKELFPDTKLAIGPTIVNGFYYDFYREIPFSTEDFGTIESRMHEIVDESIPFEKEIISKDDAISFFKRNNEQFKVELIQNLDGEISIYSQGSFKDLCRGPHGKSTKDVGHAFKLTKIAGAYWRGDPKREVLQRIYGTAWHTKKELDEHLFNMEEAAKRDHRKLGQELSLFHIQEEAKGGIFWHPKGYSLYRNLENWVREKIEDNGYVEVKTPQLLDQTFWEKSGHWEKFRSNMFVCQDDEDSLLALKPMNCPGHVQIFKQGIKSYRDLPLRMAEFGCCHRNEPSGSLHGLTRVRAMVQDDAHIFCTEDQIISETKSFCDLLKSMYNELGFKDINVKFADRPSIRAGDDSLWDKAENALKKASDEAGLSYEISKGEGAFYGPKLEFHLTDAIGRSWQCGTLQVDFVLPERLDATYIGEDGQKHRPVMLHRAILGSLERFLGILIEHYSGKFPIWLAPIQAVIAPITTEINDYANLVLSELKKAKLRAFVDNRNEKITYKVREHSLQKIPYILVVGKKEAADNTVSIRALGSDKNETMKLDEFINLLKPQGINT